MHPYSHAQEIMSSKREGDYVIQSIAIYICKILGVSVDDQIQIQQKVLFLSVSQNQMNLVLKLQSVSYVVR